VASVCASDRRKKARRSLRDKPAATVWPCGRRDERTWRQMSATHNTNVRGAQHQAVRRHVRRRGDPKRTPKRDANARRDVERRREIRRSGLPASTWCKTSRREAPAQAFSRTSTEIPRAETETPRDACSEMARRAKHDGLRRLGEPVGIGELGTNRVKAGRRWHASPKAPGARPAPTEKRGFKSKSQSEVSVCGSSLPHLNVRPETLSDGGK